MIQLSAFIIAKNEATRITKAINSLKDLVSEIIVIDSGSSDNTVSIAQSLGAKVVFNQWAGYVKQKSFGENLCKNHWIINIDADEEISPKLRQEIKNLLEYGNIDKYMAYSLNTVIMHRNDKNIRLFAPSNRVIRLYNRNFCNFSNNKSDTTHDSVFFNNEADKESKLSHQLKGAVYHRSFTSIEQLVNKANFVSGEQAKDLINKGRIPSKFRIASEIIFLFFKAYFIRRYFVFGFDGFVDSIIFAFARFIRLAKAREMALYSHKENHSNYA